MSRVRRAKLRLVHSAPPAPPAERLAEPLLELGLHLNSFRPNSRDERYHTRHRKKLKALKDRVERAAVYDLEDVLAALTFLSLDVVAPICRRDGDQALMFGGRILDKARDWVDAHSPTRPRDPPKLVG